MLILGIETSCDETSAAVVGDVGEGGRLIPAGVIYVKTSVRDVRIDTPDDGLASAAVKAAQGREGMVLNDPEVIKAYLGDD